MKSIPILNGQVSKRAFDLKLAVLICVVAAIFHSPHIQAGWHDEIGAHFPPIVPNSATGAVHYEYKFFAYAEYSGGCVPLLGTALRGQTTESGTVGGNVVKCRGAAEIKSRLRGNGYNAFCNQPLPPWLTSTLCKQDFDCTVFSPSQDIGNCNYGGGAFYNDTLYYLSLVLQNPPDCLDLVTVTSSGPGWTLKYTYPVQTPLCYFYNTFNCDCSFSGQGTVSAAVYGWSAYYEIVLDVAQGTNSPPLPSLSGSGGVGFDYGAGGGGQEAFGKRISAGEKHSLAAKLNGTVWAWGHNSEGQLGDGTTTQRPSPVQVTNLASVTAVSAGDNHSLALKYDGTVWAWGRNKYGQLGDNSDTDRSTRVQVSGLTNIIAISGGGEHSLAVKSNGTVWAWGNNSYGQLGDGTTTGRWTPVQVSNLSGITNVSAGFRFSLALKNDGTVWAWGNNSYGQLGNGTTTQSTSPVQVTNLTGVIAISAGGLHSLALKSDGNVWGWGTNHVGQLGDGTTTRRLTPVQTSGITNNVAGIEAGLYHSLAIKTNRTVWAWGHNAYYQLGDGTTTTRTSPVSSSNLSGTSAVSGGWHHSLAVQTNLTLKAWGRNTNGQLGDGTTTQRTTPTTIPSFGL